MTSDLQSAVELLRTNDYVSLIILTAILYDYVLMFSREVDYIWHKPWSWVSTMYVLVRYCGLSWAIFGGYLSGSSFVPGQLKLCTALFLVAVWDILIFLAAADLVMILRVYARWNRSKRILYILLFFYVAQIIVSFVGEGININPNTYLSVTAVEVIGISFCKISLSDTPSLDVMWSISALRSVLGAMLLILAVISTLKQSIAWYKATKQWQPNHYMQLLVKDGVLYFLANMIFIITTTSLQGHVTGNSTSQFVLVVLDYTALGPIMPRFIINVRELYDQDARGRGQGIDTGFGVSSQPVSGEDTAMSAIEFAGIAPGQGQGHRQVAEGEAVGWEVIRLDMLGDGARHV